MSVEEQRRRILLALEAPLKPPTAARQSRARLTPRQRRIEALRAAIPLEQDFERRLDLAEQLRELAALETGAPSAPRPGPGPPAPPPPRRRFTVAVPPPKPKP